MFKNGTDSVSNYWCASRVLSVITFAPWIFRKKRHVWMSVDVRTELQLSLILLKMSSVFNRNNGSCFGNHVTWLLKMASSHCALWTEKLPGRHTVIVAGAQLNKCQRLCSPPLRSLCDKGFFIIECVSWSLGQRHFTVPWWAGPGCASSLIMQGIARAITRTALSLLLCLT